MTTKGDRMKAITTTDPQTIAILNDVMKQAGQAANHQAQRVAFESHQARNAQNTGRSQETDIALFETFLQSAGVPALGMHDNPDAWRGVTWGIVEAFKQWMLQRGYAIGSINRRLSTVRTFAGIAAKAGAISTEESILIASVRGYKAKETRHIDEKRQEQGLQTRVGAKKAQAVTIPEDIAEALKQHPNTPQGRRDTLLMCLLLEHGLRVGEVAILTRKNFDLKAGTLVFYRPKVNEKQTHTLTPDTRRAAGLYLKHDAPAEGILWRKSHKGTGRLGGQLSETSAERALTKRVELLGRHAGIEGLSAHDCRHYWATYEARNQTPIDRLKQAGGWSSVAMPLRYIEESEIANEGTAKVRK